MAANSQRQKRRKSHGDDRSWGRRWNFLQLRNRDLAVILIIALISGIAATYLTAYLGVR